MCFRLDNKQREAESERIDFKELKGFSDDARAANKIMLFFYVFESQVAAE